MKKSEGNIGESHTVKNKGVVSSHSSDFNTSGQCVDHSSCIGFTDVGFSSGRTIEIRRFEFARVKVELSVGFDSDLTDKNEVQNAVELFVSEMLKSEESKISKTKYEANIENVHIELLNNCVCRRLYISYGMTTKSGKNEFESHSFDVFEHCPIEDGDDIYGQYFDLSKRLAVRLKEKFDDVKNSNNLGL